MKHFIRFLALVVILAALAAPAAGDQSFEAATPTVKAEVSGQPIFVPFSFTAYSNNGAANINMPANFVADYVIVYPDHDDTNPDAFEWFTSLGAGKAILNTGSTGVKTQVSSNGITVTSGRITLGTSVITENNMAVTGYGVRY